MSWLDHSCHSSKITAPSGVQNQRVDLPFLPLSLMNVTSARVPSGKRTVMRCVFSVDDSPAGSE
jgi:hypothetical protein